MSPLESARAILGVPAGASVAAITRAYRRLAKRYHPDRKHGNGELMARLNAARDLLLAPPPPPEPISFAARHAQREPSTYFDYLDLNLHRRAI